MGNNDRNEKEKQMLYEWGIENSERYLFQESDADKQSYFIKKQTHCYLREYNFETLPEFMKELDVLWDNDEAMKTVKKIVGVAVLKNRPLKEIKETPKETGEEKEEPKLPVFIYNF